MHSAISTLIRVSIDNEKYHLTLLDGSKWFVDLGDLPTIATWLPTTSIKIKKLPARSMFSYKLVNVDEGVSVRAAKVG